MLSGITLPMTKKEIVKFANNKIKSKKSKVEGTHDEILNTLNELSEKTYHKITDIVKEIGKLR
jgi:ribosomal protein S25